MAGIEITMRHLISCTCGILRGEILDRTAGVRAVCYCKDCQVFAAYLGKVDDVLDEAGGTEVIGLRPSNIRFTDGIDNLKSMSIDEKGLLRWYADCCKTPIGNTPRNFTISHIGLIHNCVEGAPSSLEKLFGPLMLRVNVGSAKRPVKALKASIGLIAQHFLSLVKERLSGRHKSSPFFSESGEPLMQTEVLTDDQRQKLRSSI